MKILTVCRAGLVRSVALADVLKLHFEPTDVLPMGKDFNSEDTKYMLYNWADKIVVMEEHYKNSIPESYWHKTLVCEVGPDGYGSSKNPILIDLVFSWAREHQDILGVKEHHNII